MKRLMTRGTAFSVLLMAVGLLLAACTGARQQAADASTQAPKSVSPTLAPEENYRYNQLLGRDGIRPIYDPEFIPADQAQIKDDELVLGIAIDGQAKAYPITVLNSREMVNDELAGIPILATW